MIDTLIIPYPVSEDSMGRNTCTPPGKGKQLFMAAVLNYIDI
jgi:hypothetical protein